MKIQRIVHLIVVNCFFVCGSARSMPSAAPTGAAPTNPAPDLVKHVVKVDIHRRSRPASPRPIASSRREPHKPGRTLFTIMRVLKPSNQEKDLHAVHEVRPDWSNGVPSLLRHGNFRQTDR